MRIEQNSGVLRGGIQSRPEDVSRRSGNLNGRMIELADFSAVPRPQEEPDVAGRPLAERRVVSVKPQLDSAGLKRLTTSGPKDKGEFAIRDGKIVIIDDSRLFFLNPSENKAREHIRATPEQNAQIRTCVRETLLDELSSVQREMNRGQRKIGDEEWQSLMRDVKALEADIRRELTPSDDPSRAPARLLKREAGELRERIENLHGRLYGDRAASEFGAVLDENVARDFKTVLPHSVVVGPDGRLKAERFWFKKPTKEQNAAARQRLHDWIALTAAADRVAGRGEMAAFLERVRTALIGPGKQDAELSASEAYDLMSEYLELRDDLRKPREEVRQSAAPAPQTPFVRLGDLGSVSMSYEALGEQVVRPFIDRVLPDLGVTFGDFRMKGLEDGSIEIKVGQLDLSKFLEVKGGLLASVSSYVKLLGKDITVVLKPRWQAESGTVDFEAVSLPGPLQGILSLTSVQEKLKGVLPQGVALVRGDNGAFKGVSCDLSKAVLPKLGDAGLNAKVVDNVADVRFGPGGMAVDFGGRRPNAFVSRRLDLQGGGVANVELNPAEASKMLEGKVLGLLRKKGLVAQHLKITTHGHGTVTLDLGDMDMREFFKTQKGAKGWLGRKGLLNMKGLKVTVRPVVEPKTGRLDLSITDVTGEGFGKVKAFLFKRHFLQKTIISSLTANLGKAVPADPGEGAYGRLKINVPNLLPDVLTPFGSQRLTRISVDQFGITVGIGTNWRETEERRRQEQARRAGDETGRVSK